jgi:hypothetical protein
MDQAMRTFSKLLEETHADGVMLDKIRFPGPSNGFESLLGCFCPSCSARFRWETGVALEELKQKARALLLKLRGDGTDSFLSLWEKAGSFWKAADLEDLGQFRARSVHAAVARFASIAHASGQEVGLDLFSPSLAPLVSQDYAELSKQSDWIKPMLYSRAIGPAGLPLEIGSLWKGFQAMHPGSDVALIRSRLRGTFNWELPGTEAELVARGLPAGVISSELARIAGLGLAARARTYAGIEAVHPITPDILESTLAEVRDPADGVIASWNLLSIPEENLRLLGSWKDSRRS